MFDNGNIYINVEISKLKIKIKTNTKVKHLMEGTIETLLDKSVFEREIEVERGIEGGGGYVNFHFEVTILKRLGDFWVHLLEVP